MAKLVFATHNSHKLKEVREILQTDMTLMSLKDIKCLEKIPETANTLEGNALLKAKHIYLKFGYNCFAEDTGLEVEILDGRPGIYSARYAGIDQDAQKNIEKLLKDMQGKSNRKAQFRTVIALIEDGEVHYFEGIIKGEITEKPIGEGGFGYDPVFIPEGYKQSFAEIGNDIKNKISHRALAIQQLKNYLNQKQ